MSWPRGPVRVRVPATSANLGPGFDALGLALSLHDEVAARITGGGLAIEVSGEGRSTASAGEAHLVVRAMRATFAATGGQPPGIVLRCVNAIPHGRGLGSSAAAIVSGVLAARALAAGRDSAPPGDVLPTDEVFRLAVGLEGHADNVAACLAGGLTLAWTPPAGPDERAAPGAGDSAPGAARRRAPGPRLVRLPVREDLTAVVCVPAQPLSTEAARQVLPPAVPHADAAASAARCGLLVAALAGGEAVAGDPGILFDATDDFLHQPYRAGVMPATASLLARLRRRRIAAVMSGAGPSVLALRTGGEPVAEVVDSPVAEVVDSMARETGIAWRVIPLEVDRQGACVLSGGQDADPEDWARQGSPESQELGSGHAGWSP